MRFLLHHLPDVFIAALAVCGQVYAVRQLRIRKPFAAIVLALGCSLVFCGLLLRSQRIADALPLAVSSWASLAGFLTVLASLGFAVTVAVWKFIPEPASQPDPGRRALLKTARTAVLATPVIAGGYGVFIQRDDFRLTEVAVPIPGLDKELDGLRIVQLSDIHLSPFLSRRELARTVDMANETRADLALVTGDMITSYRDPLDACIQELSRLRATAGVLGCHGNHEVYARCQNYATKEAARYGIRFLRDEAQVLRFRGRPINFTGVDYQAMRDPYLPRAERHVQPGMLNVLLSHNPDVFRTAARQGFNMVISGHTHGGQVNFEILHHSLSVARFYTPYVYGLYREENAAVYVTRGIGTVGIPARLGAPPEVALIRLCAT